MPEQASKPASARRRKSGARSTRPDPVALLAEHNRLRSLTGLAPLDPPVGRSIAGKRSARGLIDVLYGGEGAAPPTGTIFHWWGQFSAELPAPFTLPHGGHGYAEARDLEHAARVFARLRDAVLAMPSAGHREPSATREWAGISKSGNAWYRWMLPDRRQMTIEFKSPTRLTRSERQAPIAKLG